MIQDVLKLCELQLQSGRDLESRVDEAHPVDKLEPVSSAYARYAPDASFHDPIGIANGLEAVKAQFNSMPKLFSKSETKGVKVLDNPAVVSLSLQPLITFQDGMLMLETPVGAVRACSRVPRQVSPDYQAHQFVDYARGGPELQLDQAVSSPFPFRPPLSSSRGYWRPR